MNLASLENDSMLLPHDRVGSDFSWLQSTKEEDSTDRKAEELEDEESFLYGNEGTGRKPTTKSSTALFPVFSQTGEHSKLHKMDVSAPSSQQHNKSMSALGSFGDLLDLKVPLQMISSFNLDSGDYEKIRSILRSQGTADISNIMAKMQGEKQPSPADPTAAAFALPAMKNPNVQQALESLQSLIKGDNPLLNKRFNCLSISILN